MKTLFICVLFFFVSCGADKKKEVRYGPKEKSTYRKLLYCRNCISTSAVTVLKEKIKIVKGFVESKEAIGAEDYHLWIKLAKTDCVIEFNKKVLGYYRLHSNNISSRTIRQMRSELWVLKDHYHSLVPKKIYDYFFYFIKLIEIYLRNSFKIIMRR